MSGSLPTLKVMLLGCGMLLCTPALSTEQSIAGVGIAEQSLLAGTRLVLNGAGVRRFLGLKVYVAALYLPEPKYRAEDVLKDNLPRRLQMTLLREVTSEQNLQAIMTGLIENNSAAELQAIDREIAHCQAMLRRFERLPAGTVIWLDYLPGSGTRIVIGNQLQGDISGEAFNRALLKIWLGETPTQGTLKRALLGAAQAAL